MNTKLTASLTLIAFAAGCGQSTPEPGALAITGPVLVEMNPSGIAPLSGLIRFSTDVPMRATLAISDGERESTVTPVDAFNTAHELMLLGLKPNRAHTVTVNLEDESGRVTDAASFTVTTEHLPYWVPKIETLVSEPDRMEPGVTLFGVFNFTNDAEIFTVGLDYTGEVIWFVEAQMDEPRRMQNGNLLAIGGGIQNTVREFDMLGNVVRQWQGTGTAPVVPEGVIGVATDTFHHDITEMPSGNFLAISTQVHTIENYATEFRLDPPRISREILADRIIEFRPEDGAIVREWNTADFYDTSRPVYNPMAGFFYETAYENVLDEPLTDWTHTNGFFYEAETDSLILSIRKMHTVAKLDLANSEFAWMLGTDWGWAPEFQELLLEPVGNTSFPFGQHAPKITPSGTLLLFDNGTGNRSMPGTSDFPGEFQLSNDSYSRAVEFEIDEDTHTVSEVWSYGGPGSEQFFAGFVSEADRLPMTGNTLIHAGGQVVTPDGGPGSGPSEGRVWIASKEITPSGDKVWEVVIDDPTHEWASYRAERMPSLYPDI